jgi:hypothetical protein
MLRSQRLRYVYRVNAHHPTISPRSTNIYQLARPPNRYPHHLATNPRLARRLLFRDRFAHLNILFHRHPTSSHNDSLTKTDPIFLRSRAKRLVDRCLGYHLCSPPFPPRTRSRIQRTSVCRKGETRRHSRARRRAFSLERRGFAYARFRLPRMGVLCGKGTRGFIGLCQSYTEFSGGDGEFGQAVVGRSEEEDVSRQVLFCQKRSISVLTLE